MSLGNNAEEMKDAVRKELEGTEYAVSLLTPLSGGTANFIYLARLHKPLSGGVREVVLKHGEAYVALHPDFKLEMVRCNIEEESLRLLSSFPAIISSPYEVGTPKLYHFNSQTSTQIQEYLPNAINLKHYALTNFQGSSTADTKSQSLQLGKSLGRWLRGFHSWSDLPDNQSLRKLLAKNTAMRDIKKAINYDQLLGRLNMFPTILQEHQETLQQIVAMATAELGDESKLSVIHGDFWTGNILIPNAPLGNSQTVPMRIIDWEMAQVGVRAEDLGQVIAELWQLKLYKNIDAALWIIRGFVSGYGKVDTDFMFRVLIHIGAHLICIGSTTPGWGTPEQGHVIAKAGRDILLNAWKKDAKAFRGHDLQNVLG